MWADSFSDGFSQMCHRHLAHRKQFVEVDMDFVL